MTLRSTLIILGLLIIFACKQTPKKAVTKEVETAVAVEPPAPTSTFTDLEGKPVELADFKGKRVLLNFWATWCRPCIEEMPALLKAEAALAPENYVFLLASDQSMEKILAFKEKRGFDFKYLKFNGALADFEVTALPATFIYNADGKWVNRIDGATEWDSEKIIDKLKAIR